MNAINMQNRGYVSPRGTRGAPASAGDDQDSIDLGDLFAILWRRKWVLVVPLLLDSAARDATIFASVGPDRPPPDPIFLSTLRLRV